MAAEGYEHLSTQFFAGKASGQLNSVHKHLEDTDFNERLDEYRRAIKKKDGKEINVVLVDDSLKKGDVQKVVEMGLEDLFISELKELLKNVPKP